MSEEHKKTKKIKIWRLVVLSGDSRQCQLIQVE